MLKKRSGLISCALALALFFPVQGTAFAHRALFQNAAIVSQRAIPTYTRVLKTGCRGLDVSALQQRLTEQGFFSGTCDGIFGIKTQSAVKAFQKANALKADGIVGSATFAAVYGVASTAPTSTSTPTSTYKLGRLNNQVTLKKGKKGADVKDLQTVLKIKGFYSGKITGSFQSETKDAVMRFQRSVCLKSDGIAGNYTLSALYTMLNPPELSTIAPWPAGQEAYAGIPTEKLLWSDVSCNVFKKGLDAVIVDVRSGYVFNVRRTGGSKHADVETITPADTATFYKASGNFSWSRRPIWVIVNGHRLAASMNCMPHGYDTLASNDFKGQFCIHFVGSKTHGTNKIDPDHQACIEEAYQAGLAPAPTPTLAPTPEPTVTPSPTSTPTSTPVTTPTPTP